MFKKISNYFKIRKMFNKAIYLKDEKEMYDEALEIFKEILKFDESDEYTLISISEIYIKQKRYNKALECIEKTIGEYNNNPVVYIIKGIALYYLELIEEAEDVLLKGLEFDKIHPVANYYLGLLNIKKKSYEKASEYFEILIAEKPNFILSRLLVSVEKNFIENNII